MDRKALFITLMAIGVLHPYAFSNEQIEKEPTEDVLNQRIDSVYRTVYYEDFEQAAVVLRQVKHEAEDATLWHVQLSALLNLHYCAQHHGVVEDMVLYLDEARDVYRNRESEMPVDWCKKLRQKVRYAEANAAYNFGEYERAVQHFKMILESGDTLEPVFHYKCLSYVGHAYASMDNYDLAIAHHDQALAYLPPGEKYDYYRGVSFSYLGIAYKRLHDLKLDEAALRKARSSCLTSLSYFLKSSNKNTRGPIGCYSLLSEIYGLLGQPDSSAYYLTQGQLLDPESIEIHRVWGMHYGRLGQYEKARQHVRKSSAIIRESRGDRHFLIGRNLVQVGNHYKEEARWEQAVQHYQRAFRYLGAEDSLTENVYAHPHLADVISPKDFFECLIAKAFALKEWSGTPHTPDALLRLKKSIETYELAVQFIDQQRSKFESPAYKQLMAAKALSVYEQAIDACYLAIDKGLDSLSYTQLAFYFMEKNKNRQLREALRVSQSNRYAGVPDSLLKKEADLGQKLRYYNRLLTRQKMSSIQKPTKTLRMEQEVFALNNQWERLNSDLITNYPDYFRLKYGEPIMDLKTVQAKLEEGSLLLAYFYGDQDVFLFGVNRETITFEKLRFSTKMANGLSQMLQQIKHPSTGRPPVELMRHLHALHQFLLPESQETLEGVGELI
ncbi:MAG: tetratricopeptide repeat protein, partial [Bacteroidota bacterium]